MWDETKEETSENKSYVVENIDAYNTTVSKTQYDPEYLGIKSLGPVMIICGQSLSGKSVLLNNIFIKKLIWEYPPENIYFFNKTIRGDLTYKPLLKHLASQKKKINIFDKVDFEKINDIVKKQEQVGMSQMYALTKQDEPELKKILFIFDDMLSDKAFKHHKSSLSDFSCLC